MEVNKILSEKTPTIEPASIQFEGLTINDPKITRLVDNLKILISSKGIKLDIESVAVLKAQLNNLGLKSISDSILMQLGDLNNDGRIDLSAGEGVKATVTAEGIQNVNVGDSITLGEASCSFCELVFKKGQQLFGITSSKSLENVNIDEDSNGRIRAYNKFAEDFSGSKAPRGNIGELTADRILEYEGVGTASEELADSFGYSVKTDQMWLYNRHYNPSSIPKTIANYKDGSTAEYKLHISASLQDYDQIVLMMGKFFDKNNILAKVAPGKLVAKPEMGNQYGKVFTIYTSNSQQMMQVIVEAQRLHREYGLNGIPTEEFSRTNAYLQYEVAIPETGSMVYYTIEKYNGEGLSYPDRKRYLSRYWGEGPLDKWIDSIGKTNLDTTTQINPIENAKTFNDLYSVLNSIQGIQGSSQFYASSDLISAIGGVRSGALRINSITRNAGLREKVMGLLILESNDFNQLYSNLDKITEITGSDETIYTSQQLKNYIEDVRNGRMGVNSITRSLGLRNKVSELLNKG